MASMDAAQKRQAVEEALLEESRRRRAAFYDAEQRDFDRMRGSGFKPEEPNIRVYARAIQNLVEMARRGLPTEQYRSLTEMLRADLVE